VGTRHPSASGRNPETEARSREFLQRFGEWPIAVDSNPASRRLGEVRPPILGRHREPEKTGSEQ
jgi:hypothetical protein